MKNKKQLFIFDEETLEYKQYKKRNNILLIIVIGVFILSSFLIPKKDKKKFIIEKKVIHYVDSVPELNKENLWKEITKNNILFPKVVYQQAIGETGHLKSKSCLEANNLFGFKVFPSSRYDTTYHLKNIKHLDHLVFKSWIDCVKHYKEYQKTNFTKKYYYEYLKRSGYAESPNYLKLLKQIKTPNLTKQKTNQKKNKMIQMNFLDALYTWKVEAEQKFEKLLEKKSK